jgi:hypothetical protein
VHAEGGIEALQLRVAEQYVQQFGNIAKASTTLVLPANAADVGSMVALAMQVLRTGERPAPPPVPPRRS